MCECVCVCVCVCLCACVRMPVECVPVRARGCDFNQHLDLAKGINQCIVPYSHSVQLMRRGSFLQLTSCGGACCEEDRTLRNPITSQLPFRHLHSVFGGTCLGAIEQKGNMSLNHEGT